MFQRKKGIAARAATRSKETTAWAKSIKAGTVLVARVHPDEVNTRNEPYFLAICAGNGSEALLWRNAKTQEVDGNLFKKGFWLVRLR